ncbi:hypothetical protein [Bradyrhizobium sp. WD16]|uniref:hypothetical protein n=1 Tax=Bradyrhizobium sp. WD16 TaxID=1521768 RepID=UPI0020A235AA|nr:hypothetical protein [Bradyrhizobium sp. WD16]
MISINQEIERLEQCAQECVLISLLATDRHVRRKKHALAAEYQAMIVGLKTIEPPPLVA